MAKTAKLPKAESNDPTPASEPADTDEARQDEVTTANHSAGSNDSGRISADDLVPEILERGDALSHTEVSGFTVILVTHIALGKPLNKAKDALEHGAWTPWFEAQQFPFSMRKAQRCMRFADYEQELLAWAEENRQQLAVLAAEGHQLGVEDAENFIKRLKDKRKAEAEAKAEAEKAIAEAKAAAHLEAVLGDLEAALEKIRADIAAEIIGRVWDQAKREQFVALLATSHVN
jgi:hypothetical protein